MRKETKTITCTCGADYKVQTEFPSSKIDICANCHPFYTGKQKVVDSEGRIEKFNKKYGKDYLKKD